MKVIGLTGSIGMGKTTVSRQFALEGAAVCSADALVHRLLSKGGAGVAEVAALFPDAYVEESIHRVKLGQAVFGKPEALEKLEAILHPLVQELEYAFIERQRRLGRKRVVLDIPLLFETGGEARCDYTVVVSAPGFVQRQRVLARLGMTEQKLAAILARQLPDARKRMAADFVIHTGLGRAYSFRQVQKIMKAIADA